MPIVRIVYIERPFPVFLVRGRQRRVCDAGRHLSLPGSATLSGWSQHSFAAAKRLGTGHSEGFTVLPGQ